MSDDLENVPPRPDEQPPDVRAVVGLLSNALELERKPK